MSHWARIQHEQAEQDSTNTEQICVSANNRFQHVSCVWVIKAMRPLCFTKRASHFCKLPNYSKCTNTVEKKKWKSVHCLTIVIVLSRTNSNFGTNNIFKIFRSWKMSAANRIRKTVMVQCRHPQSKQFPLLLHQNQQKAYLLHPLQKRSPQHPLHLLKR